MLSLKNEGGVDGGGYLPPGSPRLDVHHLQEAARHLTVLKKAKLATWHPGPVLELGQWVYLGTSFPWGSLKNSMVANGAEPSATNWDNQENHQPGFSGIDGCMISNQVMVGGFSHMTGEHIFPKFGMG